MLSSGVTMMKKGGPSLQEADVLEQPTRCQGCTKESSYKKG